MSRRTKPLGLRREVLLFLPTAILLLAVIASFDLLVYRNAIHDIEGERLAEARGLAQHVASRLSTGAAPSNERLEGLAPQASGIQVEDRAGRVLARRGAPVSTLHLQSPTAGVGESFGPIDLQAPRVSARAPFERSGRSLTVQVDLPAERLAAHRAGLKRILWLNAAILGSLTILVLLFLRRLLTPYETLLEAARRIESDDASGPEQVGEVEFLVTTFEEMLAELERRRLDPPDDIGLLEETLAPSLESGFMLLDQGGQVLAVNDLGATLLDIERPTTRASLERVLERHPTMLDIVVSAVETKSSIQREECSITSAASERIIGLTVHPLRRDDREIRGFIVLFADLTDSQAAERREQLDRSLAELGELSAGVAHELRNGLATFKGYLGLIEHGGAEDSIEDYLQEMRNEGDHLERVLNDFLSFARPESMRLETLDLMMLLERAVADPALSDARIDLDPGAKAVEVNGDPDLLERAVRNLLHNAVQAHAEVASLEPIRVRLELEGTRVSIVIEDEGPGLSETVQERLFQPFSSGRADGVGLGLALSRRIASVHHGTLEVADREGAGVRARLSLPVQSVT